MQYFGQFSLSNPLRTGTVRAPFATQSFGQHARESAAEGSPGSAGILPAFSQGKNFLRTSPGKWAKDAFVDEKLALLLAHQCQQIPVGITKECHP